MKLSKITKQKKNEYDQNSYRGETIKVTSLKQTEKGRDKRQEKGTVDHQL